MNDFISFTNPADILALIPHTLGEQPKESFVVMTMNGTRLGATLRVDAPFAADPRGYAQTLVSHLSADENATGTLLVIYTDENSPGNSRPYWAHVEALSTELATAEMPLKDAWMVTAHAWRNYLCTDPGCCPDEPLEAITTSNGNAELIYRGSMVTGFTAPEPFTGDAGVRETIKAHTPEGWPGEVDRSRAIWSEALDNPEALTAGRAHELAGAFQHPTVRDYLMADVMTTAPEQFTSVLLGVVLARPDWARVDRAQEIAFELMKATPEGQRAPMLCLIGWLEWLKGKSSFAARYFKLAMDDVTDYRLASLLTELLNRGLVADCARNKAMSYTPTIR
ncbi:DUF4192 domain-containing protein [Arthrobacter sp. NPDC080073]|uniref:DUF4192 domain-containing protein n=1 Tax=Arthrobacter sp. NPDC080073 TaxID=3155919 RepID=UPI00342FDD26